MKKFTFLLIIMLFFLAVCNIFGQQTAYPFEVKKSGKGNQSLIFIPGFASSGDVWSETAAKFENNFTCYTLTMAGFAGTKPQAEASFKDWENGIAAYIRNNKIDKPIIIGHSMGGGLALAIAADYPELAGKIIIVDALPCLAAMSDPNFTSKENNDCSSTITQLTAMNDEQFRKMQAQAIPRLLADPSMQETVIGWSVKSDRKTFAKMYCDFFNTDLREKIKNIQCPSLILLESFFVNLKPTIESQYRNLKNANMQYASKGLHFIMYDDKDWYLNQLANFLSSK
ncbi:Pimelyl-[acyl-carrier protein] methyl ester esterase [Chryseobacterium gleum]|uniref:Pimelyl-[acyl-carrier protein] methyl ester esterase n=2 Tax=Chryseobacterium gleum TaxID=250 RepID=A0A448B3J3_CHRGE|nr:alpha/beta hydrolase [Chryseobacterium gleum]EFK36324.1 hydrolase, alpha/beta domain protein [Chryseobacterium gleum ATCC 35910]QQY33569.1 alpha/beta hydrolase [Chryseobacterium gleum]VEE08485.1 Pimelyl-[acyl-carrier protein] methyl ester esterase [Chryseobacterium gleum]